MSGARTRLLVMQRDACFNLLQGFVRLRPRWSAISAIAYSGKVKSRLVRPRFCKRSCFAVVRQVALALLFVQEPTSAWYSNLWGSVVFVYLAAGMRIIQVSHLGGDILVVISMLTQMALVWLR